MAVETKEGRNRPLRSVVRNPWPYGRYPRRAACAHADRKRSGRKACHRPRRDRRIASNPARFPASSNAPARLPIWRRPRSRSIIAELGAFPARLADRQPVQRQRHVAGQNLQQIAREDEPDAPATGRRQMSRRYRSNVRTLLAWIADHRRQQTVAIAEPFVEAFLGAVGCPRDACRRQRLLATIDKQPQRAAPERRSGAANNPAGAGGRQAAKIYLHPQYRTVRFAAYAAKQGAVKPLLQRNLRPLARACRRISRRLQTY